MAIRKVTADKPCGKETSGYCGRGRKPAGGDYHWHEAKRGDLQDRIDDLRDQRKEMKMSGDVFDAKAGLITVEAYALIWAQRQSHQKPATVRAVAGIIRNRLRTFTPVGYREPITNMAIRDVRWVHLDEWLKWMAKSANNGKPYAEATLDTSWGYVKAIFVSAFAENIIRRNPCIGPEGKQLSPPDYDVLAEPVKAPVLGDLLAIRDNLPIRVRLFVELGAQTGLRPGELLGLDLADIEPLNKGKALYSTADLAQGWISITQQAGLVCDDESKPILERKYRRAIVPWTKTPKSRRRIPVGATTLDLILKHLSENGRSPADGGKLFLSRAGTPVLMADFSRMWDNAKAKAGVTDEAAHPHGLRHYYASVMLSSRACSIVALRDLLGHKSQSRTTDLYAHFQPQEQDTVRDAVAQVWAQHKASEASEQESTADTEQ